MLEVYGGRQNRGFRTFWMLEELGLEHKAIAKDTQAGETRTPDYLAINPNGHVPTLVDDGTIVWESMAINLYLAKKHGGPLAPASLQEEADALKWSFWVMTEVEGNLLAYGMNTAFLPEEERDPKAANEAREKLAGALGVLDAALAKQPYLAGSRFTVADLNVASVLSWATLVQFDLAAYPNVGRWLGECLGRPAVQRARGD